MKKIIPPLVFALLPLACSWDNEAELYPSTGQECDTLQVAYATHVATLLEASCFSCHSETNAPAFGGNLSLETYDDVSARADRILGAVRHEEGFTPMPQGGGTLTECDILTIEAWINQGKPQ